MVIGTESPRPVPDPVEQFNQAMDRSLIKWCEVDRAPRPLRAADCISACLVLLRQTPAATGSDSSQAQALGFEPALEFDRVTHEEAGQQVAAVHIHGRFRIPAGRLTLESLDIAED